MGTQKLNLFIDFDDVVVRTRPRLEKELLKAYKYASPYYWDDLETSILEEYRQKMNEIRQREAVIRQQKGFNQDLLDELYALEMNLYTEYIRQNEEVKEDSKYLGANIDYVLEVLNNSDVYHDGDNPNSPYYVNYNEILNMCYAMPNAIEFVKTVTMLPHIDAKILSHINCKREYVRKEKIIKEHIGDIPLYTLYFHSDSFSPGKRCMNSKAEYVMNLYELSHLDETFVLIDDSKTNVLDWMSHGGKGILFSKTYVEGFPYQLSELTYEAFSNCIDNKEKQLVKR